MKKFSVIGYFEDSQRPFIIHVTAEDSCDAVVVAYRKLVKEDTADGALSPSEDLDLANLMLIDVVGGWVKSDLDRESVCCFCDWPGLDDEEQETA